jgi:hypothetical protein
MQAYSFNISMYVDLPNKIIHKHINIEPSQVRRSKLGLNVSESDPGKHHHLICPEGLAPLTYQPVAYN